MCGERAVQKYGRQGGAQRYRCLKCAHNFQSKRRPQKKQASLWERYTWGKHSLSELASEEERSVPWVRKNLDAATSTHVSVPPQPTVILADTTFWGRGYGVCVFRSASLKRNLCWTEVKDETAAVYAQSLKGLLERGWQITATVIDGRRGVARVFEQHGIPVQFCQFHQMKTVTKYVTRRPKTEAAQELRALSLTLHKTNEGDFVRALTAWQARHETFLKERSPAPHRKSGWEYTHRRLKSAHRSLKTNLQYLFTYQKYPDLSIPNTTNSLDGSFSQLKKKVSTHGGLRRDRRFKMISALLAAGSKRPTRKRH
jgi:hypothetical protein